jgi:phosphoglycolate phosphatase-like HAD superfamily hydrolase
MLLELATRFNILLRDSFLLGDSQKDITAGKRAGVKTILLQKSYNKDIHGTADYNCSTYDEILELL